MFSFLFSTSIDQPVIIGAIGLPFKPFWPFSALLLTFNGLLNPLLNYGRNRETQKAMLQMLKSRHQDRRISNQLPAVR